MLFSLFLRGYKTELTQSRYKLNRWLYSDYTMRTFCELRETAGGFIWAGEGTWLSHTGRQL